MLGSYSMGFTVAKRQPETLFIQTMDAALNP